MDTKFFRVDRIEGDYAYLKEEKTGDEVFIAMALLPEGTEEGSRLEYEMFSYTLCE